ncbi:YpiB family protein [Caldalkalibacillus salinus]|uniref:YpiB family protein n=1 Tax=Caldalkalibacillus salinus TaxID=2803787 RepID=UPI001920A5D5|nr:YpiB family protein [Caldalkalibacillus salinus]
MNHVISTEDKRAFLNWFLDTFELQKRECAWLLTYLKSDDQLLKHVRFVDEFITSKRSIFMSTKCQNDVSFKFSKNAFTTTDVERAFHDIRLNPNEQILMKLSFKNSESCPKYAAVREVPPGETGSTSTNSWYSLLAEMVLDEALETYQKKTLYNDINRALENKDKDTFLELSARWSNLMKDSD